MRTGRLRRKRVGVLAVSGPLFLLVIYFFLINLIFRVMENGGINLLEWRMLLQDELNAAREKERDSGPIAAAGSSKIRTGGHSKANGGQLNESTIALLLSLYLDALYIIKSVHAADIAHFDVKCNNFILRDDPRRYSSLLLNSHKNGSASGVIFLADFGEAVPHLSVDRSHPLRKRCRGTITIQSPEMLCVSDSLNMSASTDDFARSNSGGVFEYGFSSRLDEKEKAIDMVNPLRSNALRQFNELEIVDRSGSLLNNIGSSMSMGSVQSYDDGGTMLSNLTENEDALAPGKKKEVGKRSKPQSNLGNTRKLFHMPDKSSDIWSLGCLLVELLTGVQLFNDRAWTDMFVTLCMERFHPIPLNCIVDVLGVLDVAAVNRVERLACRSLQQDPSDRAEIDSLIEETDSILEEFFGDILMFSDIGGIGGDTEKEKSLGSPTAALSPLKLSRIPLQSQSSGKFNLDPIQVPSSPLASNHTASSNGQQPKPNVVVNNIFRSLRSQQIPIDNQLISLGALGEVYISFEGLEKIIKYFDGLVSLHSSGSKKPPQQFDILRRVGLVDEAVQRCDMAAACEKIGRSFLQCKFYPSRYIVWIRVIPSVLTGDAVAVVSDGAGRKHRQKDSGDDAAELFELFLLKSHKEVTTFALPLTCPGADNRTAGSVDDSLEKMLALAGDIAKQIWDRIQKQAQNQPGSQCVVIVSVDPLKQSLSPALSADSSNQDTQRSQRAALPPTGNPTCTSNSQSLFDRQTLTVAAALGAVCQSFLTPQVAKGQGVWNSSASGAFAGSSGMPLRRLFPCWDHQFEPHLFDHIVEAVTKLVLQRR